MIDLRTEERVIEAFAGPDDEVVVEQRLRFFSRPERETMTLLELTELRASYRSRGLTRIVDRIRILEAPALDDTTIATINHAHQSGLGVRWMR